MSLSAAAPAPKQRTFLGHPLGLYVLFFTEMWERFSYYGMRALLMLYMLNYFKMYQKDASTIYKVYTSFVYVTPILGGFLADRFLGNKRAVIIGAVAMAIGHFLMAFEEKFIFFSALIFLMIGNGFFKPNMSTQVGRLYPVGDGRRDGAYTIFYMGINLGAFLSPLVCGWLAENTVGEYHTGFTMAGIGMVAGLVIYLVGQPLVREIAVTPTSPPQGGPNDEPYGDPGEIAGTTAAHEEMKAGKAPAALPEEKAEKVPSSLGGVVSGAMPAVLYVLGALLVLYAVAQVLLWLAPAAWDLWHMDIWDSIMVAMGGVCLGLIAFVASQVRGGMRDRVLTILILGVFVMFFWAAFEQAGNVLNVWADKHTNRYLTKEAPPADPVPSVVEDETKAEGDQPRAPEGVLRRFVTMWALKPAPLGKAPEGWGAWLTNSLNPMPTAWFQSINALAIFVLAPVFAWMWVLLDKRKLQPSIPMKMFIGLVMMSASVGIMIAAARQENQASAAVAQGASLPAAISVNDANQVGYKTKKGDWEPFQAGRLTYDKATNTLHMLGVLPDNERDRMLEMTAPESFQKKVEELQKKSEDADFAKVSSVEEKIDEVPPGFDMKYAGIKQSAVEYQAADQTLVAHKKLADKEVKGLLVAGSDRSFRDTLNELYVASNKFQVSWTWLFWSYILATIGELCLSPVGLSMVSKLAPARYGTMLMGVWMLTSAFGNFVAGTLGEIWGTIPPIQFFLYTTVVVAAAALVLLVLAKKIVSMMHGVQ